MTFVGKVLVVVQLVLSICFMAFAGAVVAVQTTWKQKAETLQVDVEERMKTMTELQDQLGNVQADANKRVKNAEERADQADAKNAQLVNQVKSLNNELQTTKTERDNQQALADIASEEADMRRAEAILQRTVNQQLHTMLDGLSDQVRDLRDEIFNTERANKTIVQKHGRILKELADAKMILRRHKLDTEAAKVAGETTPPPSVGGLVLTTRKGKKQGTEFIEISIGSDDGLLKGHQLFVYRTAGNNKGRAKYLGKIEIQYLEPDRSVGTVIVKAKNGVIQRGDNVTTKL